MHKNTWTWFLSLAALSTQIGTVITNATQSQPLPFSTFFSAAEDDYLFQTNDQGHLIGNFALDILTIKNTIQTEYAIYFYETGMTTIRQGQHLLNQQLVESYMTTTYDYHPTEGGIFTSILVASHPSMNRLLYRPFSQDHFKNITKYYDQGQTILNGGLREILSLPLTDLIIGGEVLPGGITRYTLPVIDLLGSLKPFSYLSGFTPTAVTMTIETSIHNDDLNLYLSAQNNEQSYEATFRFYDPRQINPEFYTLSASDKLEYRK